jgi:hypothetical protein
MIIIGLVLINLIIILIIYAITELWPKHNKIPKLIIKNKPIELNKYNLTINRQLNVHIVFVCNIFDIYDYDFIMKWCDKINFTVVINGKNNNLIDKLPKSIEIIFINVNNHDIGMWKCYILNKINFITELDILILMNNSMLYNKIDMNELINCSVYYDLFSLCGYPGVRNIFTHNNSIPILFSPLTIYNFNRININDFINYWHKLKIGTRKEALYHEIIQARYYRNKGYMKFGVYNLLYIAPLKYAWIKTNINNEEFKYVVKKINVIGQNNNYLSWLNTN